MPTNKLLKTGKIIFLVALLVFILGIILILYSLYDYIKCNNTTHIWCGLAFIGANISFLFLILPSLILSIIGVLLMKKGRLSIIPLIILILTIVGYFLI